MTVELVSEIPAALRQPGKSPLAASREVPVAAKGLSPSPSDPAAPRIATSETAPLAVTGKYETPVMPSPAAATAQAEPEAAAPLRPAPLATRSISADEARWEGAIVERIEKLKRYPRSALASGAEDRIMLRIFIARDGDIVRAEIARSRANPLLDAGAIKLAWRASPYPPPPSSVAGETVSIVVPVDYRLKRGMLPAGGL
jgi:protein TonB